MDTGQAVQALSEGTAMLPPWLSLSSRISNFEKSVYKRQLSLML
jgi:hypothetical protein